MTSAERLAQQIRKVEKWPKQIGKADYLRHLRGEKLTRDEAIKGCCYACVCGEETRPCVVRFCTLRPYCQWGAEDIES